MLVYTTELVLEPTEDALQHLRGAIQNWLLKKIGEKFAGQIVIPFGEKRFTDKDGKSHKVQIIGTPPDSMPQYCNVKYSHHDADSYGRYWVTSIGFIHRHPKMPIRCTILLETLDVSTVVAAVPVTPSIPGIVNRITSACKLNKWTLSNQIFRLTHENAELFLEWIYKEDRDAPIILVSSDNEDRVPLVDLEDLRKKMLGIAHVAYIPNSLEASLIGGIIPKRYQAWNGSITIIRQSRKGDPQSKFYTRETILEYGHFNNYIFERVAHLQNLRKSRVHIGENQVREFLTNFNIERLKEELKLQGDLSQFEELVASYEEDANRLKVIASEKQEELFNKEIENEDLQNQNDSLRDKIRSLKYQLSQSRQIDYIEPKTPLITERSPESYSHIIDILDEKEDPGIVLTSKAERSLKKCYFDDLDRVWKVIQMLEYDFYKIFSEGHEVEPVIEKLKREASGSYVANTSETTLGRFDGYTAVHNGLTYTGKKHIKLGSSRNPQYCFRLYFDWDDRNDQIVIVHAGAHLDNNLT